MSEDTFQTEDEYVAAQKLRARPSPTGEKVEAVDRICQYVEDIIIEADVDYPAGREAGPRIEYDSDAIHTFVAATLAALEAERDEARAELKLWQDAKHSSPALAAANARVEELCDALRDGLKELDRSQRPSFAWQRRVAALLKRMSIARAALTGGENG